MATPPRVSDDPDVQAHYVAQAGLGALLVARIRSVWGRLAGVPDETVVDVVEALVTQFGGASVSLSADFYEDMRAKAGVSGSFRTPVVDPPSREWVESSIGWALDVPAVEEPVVEDDTDDVDVAPESSIVWDDEDTDTVSTETEVVEDPRLARVAAAAEKMVADVGRNELIEAIEADNKARGWARVTRPGACAFCLLMATRGAVYKDQGAAGRDANSKFVGAGNFKFHNNCHCTIQPLFGRIYEPPEHIREAKKLYRDATKGESDKVNAFRRALEGREDGPRRPRKGQGSDSSPNPTQDGGFESLTRAQVELQISILEGLKDSEWRTNQLRRFRARLAELS